MPAPIRGNSVLAMTRPRAAAVPMARRRGAVALAWLAVLAHLLQTLHAVGTAHVWCIEHGRLEHVSWAVSCAEHRAHGCCHDREHGGERPTAPDPAEGDGDHDACELQQPLPADCPKVAPAPGPAAPVHLARQVLYAQDGAVRDVLALAPKHSPPRRAPC
jgi:hypothetical protein